MRKSQCWTPFKPPAYPLSSMTYSFAGDVFQPKRRSQSIVAASFYASVYLTLLIGLIIHILHYLIIFAVDCRFSSVGRRDGFQKMITDCDGHQYRLTKFRRPTLTAVVDDRQCRLVCRSLYHDNVYGVYLRRSLHLLFKNLVFFLAFFSTMQCIGRSLSKFEVENCCWYRDSSAVDTKWKWLGTSMSVSLMQRG